MMPQRETTTRALIAAALLLGAGCGTTQPAQTKPNPFDPANDEPAPKSSGRRADAEPSADPLAARPGAAPKIERRDISGDAHQAFESAVARWEKSKRDGGRTDCDLADTFGRVADQYPDLLEARHNQAAVLQDCGHESDAVRIWEKLAGGSRPYAAALSSLGYLAWKQGSPDRAERLFEQAVQADKQLGSVAARLNLAQMYREKARHASQSERPRLNKVAIDHLRSVLAVDGNNLRAYAVLCFFYYDLELPEMAKLVGDQAIGRAEEIATGKFLDEKGQLAEEKNGGGGGRKGRGRRPAAETSEKSSKEVVTAQGTGYTADMKKNLGMVYNTLGLVALRRKSVSQAIANFRRAVEMDAELHEARMNLGALSLNYRDYKTAEDNFRAVLAAQPKNYGAAIGLGVALRGGKKIDEAELQYVAAQRLDPQDPDSYFDLGILYQEYKGTDKAGLIKAQNYYREFLQHARSSTKRREAEKRIKDIDETMAALEEAARMQKEAEEMQRKMEEQQKKMEKEMQQQQEKEKQSQPAEPPPASPAPGAVSRSGGPGARAK
jgi:tetratricopeptide (TPR) repeat protein